MVAMWCLVRRSGRTAIYQLTFFLPLSSGVCVLWRAMVEHCLYRQVSRKLEPEEVSEGLQRGRLERKDLVCFLGYAV